MSEPTLTQLGRLRVLAREVGEKPPRPRTSAVAWQEIARLEVKAEFIRRVQDCLARKGAVDGVHADRAPGPGRRFNSSGDRSTWTGASAGLRWWM